MSRCAANHPLLDDLTLQCTPASIGRARERVTTQLAGMLSEEHLNAARLLVTELVTNSVRHAGDGDVRVALSIEGDEVRVEVQDSGPGFQGPREPDPVNGGGYGLVLVEQLSNQWGICCNGHTSVWFSLPRS